MQGALCHIGPGFWTAMHFRRGLVLLVVLFGCTAKTADEEGRLKTVVAKYNYALVEAYKNQSYEPLKEVAVEREVEKVYTLITAYLQTNQVMYSELLRADFKRIEKGEGSATVRTSEDWRYKWVDYRTNKEIEPLKEVHYEMLYHLTKKDGAWMVEKVEEVN